MSDKLGALWKNKNRINENSPVASGILEIGGEKIKVVLFSNKNKLSENSPDWTLLKSREKVDGAAAAREYAKKVNEEELDIPF